MIAYLVIQRRGFNEIPSTQDICAPSRVRIVNVNFYESKP